MQVGYTGTLLKVVSDSPMSSTFQLMDVRDAVALNVCVVAGPTETIHDCMWVSLKRTVLLMIALRLVMACGRLSPMATMCLL